MQDIPRSDQAVTKQQILDRVRPLIPNFAKRAEAAEQARRLPIESIQELLEAGIARILMPPHFGGYGLGFDTWFDVTREISKADASHGWCAALIIHHAHCIAQFPEEAQKAIWADGPDVAVAASFLPGTTIVPQDGGYRVSGKSAFASGVGHSTWVFVSGMVDEDGQPERAFFLIPKAEYTVADTWFTAGMRGTGSNTVVTDNVFVPKSRSLLSSQLREGKGPGGALHQSHIFRAPFASYAGLTFATPMLGAAQGAYERFREGTKTRKGVYGNLVAEQTSTQIQLARTAADLDAAEFLLRRAADTAGASAPPDPALRARSLRDYTRAGELALSAIDALIAMSGASGFAESNPIQRAWRDIHFASMHISLNPENTLSHFGRIELGLPRSPHMPFY